MSCDPMPRRERRLERQHLVERQPQAVDVAPRGPPARRNRSGAMYRSVPTTSPGRVSSSLPSALARPKSVTQIVPCEVEQQVGRLDVAVEDPVGVGIVPGPRPPARPAARRSR